MFARGTLYFIVFLFHLHLNLFIFLPVDFFLIYSFIFLTLCLSELRLHLQSSFESEDNTSEELFADPDTPVALVPDQLVAPAYTQQPDPANDVLPRANPKPADFNLNTNWPLSENLRDLRLETRRFISPVTFIVQRIYRFIRFSEQTTYIHKINFYFLFSQLSFHIPLIFPVK